MSRVASSRAEEEFILLNAGVAERRHATRARAVELTREVDWSRLANTLQSRRLLPALGPRVLELAAGRPDDHFAATVGRAVETVRRQATFLQLVSARVMTVLAEAEIRCAPLKGPLLSQAIYGDLGRRLSSDIDLLVAPEQLATAVEVVRQLGYAAPTDHVQKCGLPQLHFMLAHQDQKLPPVELHWRVHWYERSFARERLLPPTIDAPGEWRPAPADELAALLLFYARDGFIDLRMATDLSAWWDVYGAEVGPRALDEVRHAYPALAHTLSAAAKVADNVIGLPATHITGGTARLSLRDRTAVRLANPSPRSSQSQLYADMGLIDGLLSPPGGFGAFVRRQLVPPREVLDQQARYGARRRARSRLGRCMGVLARYVLRAVHLVHTSKM